MTLLRSPVSLEPAGSEISHEAPESGTVSTPVAATTRIAFAALLLVPAVLIVWMGWRHRWTADDGFINLRIVRHIVEGHGPVFNTGQRIEAGTSPLWLAVLSAFDLVTPFRLEWIAAISALAATGGALAVTVFGTRRAIAPAWPAGVVLLPLGALVYAALPPAWDFATSGLENGLGLLWIATCWWLLCARIASGSWDATPRWWVPVVLSLGPLVRPDFAVFSVAFVAALLVLCERRRATVVRVLVLSATVPLLTELARMAYYGRIVPATAIAKEATSSNWSQGWAYLRDFDSTYALIIPVALLLGCWLVVGRNRAQSRYRAVGAIVVAGGALHAIYITRVGGDFMHARMLLPTTFVVLLPVSVVAVRGATRWLAVVVVAWAVACALWLRPPYSAALATGESAATAPDPYDVRTGIADERLFWVRMSGSAHPITIDDYLPYNNSARAAERIARWAAAGRSGLMLDHYGGARTLIPLRHGFDPHIIVSAPSLGLVGYAAGDQVEVIDDHGLASVLAAHQRLEARGRPGHEKALSDAWVVAQFADPEAALPPQIDPREVAAARRALSCAPLRNLLDRTTRALTVGTAVNDVAGAFGTSGYRFASEPSVAEREACGPGKR